ncbi:uncharacterized protein [Battus philenor]|uniref:uncharacterized protein n=1 Tax=Battus philenor TaxID=42288 RepID=UPI0035D0BA84
MHPIPERDWRLLAALARKRDEDKERDILADQFRRMWLKEKQERQVIENETSEQFKRYIHEKRSRDRECFESLQRQRGLEQQARRCELMDHIRCKEQRCAHLLDLHDNIKMNRLIGMALQEESRAFLAADRRSRQCAADDWRRRTHLVYEQRREQDATQRRSARLKDTSQRVAISNALGKWETAHVRQELGALEEVRRAGAAAQVELTNRRSRRWVKDRDTRAEQARNLAAFTARLREAVKSGQL